MVSALLEREVPLYVAPKEMLTSGAALPVGLAGAANVLIMPRPQAGAAGYVFEGCKVREALKACIYRRPGPCHADPYWTYQAALGREDL